MASDARRTYGIFEALDKWLVELFKLTKVRFKFDEQFSVRTKLVFSLFEFAAMTVPHSHQVRLTYPDVSSWSE